MGYKTLTHAKEIVYLEQVGRMACAYPSSNIVWSISPPLIRIKQDVILLERDAVYNVNSHLYEKQHLPGRRVRAYLAQQWCRGDRIQFWCKGKMVYLNHYRALYAANLAIGEEE